MANAFPNARRDDLVTQEIADEVMIYDLRSHQVHCLNASAAAIWQACDGSISVDSISEKAVEKFGFQFDADTVRNALGRLQECNLLEDALPALATEVSMSRRDLIKKIGGGAVVMLPLITTIVAPTPAMAQSCGVQGPQGPQGPQGFFGF